MEDSPSSESYSSAAAQSSSSKSVEPSAAKSKSKALAKSTVPVPDELRNHPLYRVLKLIGRGGMGNVFLVEHKLTARKEVLKVIHPHLLSRDDVRGRFKREIQSAAKLNHPNVVQTLTAIEEGGLIGLVMEYVQGESLSSMVNRVGPLPVDRARDFVKQIALGLEHAHLQNMVHRDIKPQNLLVSKEGNGFRVRILDFGLAKTTGLAASNSDLTIDGAIIGTPSFMAPEQAINPTDADIRSDLYSLGCTWFFLLTGRSPFEAESPLAILNAHQNKPLPLVNSLRLGVPDATERILAKMMAKSPEDRFQTPSELIEALKSANEPSPVANAPVVNALVARKGQKEPEKLAFDVLAPKPRKKKTESKFASIIQVAMFAVPSAVLIGVLMFRPQWITNLGQLSRQADGTKTESIEPGFARIVLANVPPDVQILIDDYPARFERNRADAKPSILAKPGTYQLTARRQNEEFFRRSVALVERQSLELDMSNAKPPPKSSGRAVENNNNNNVVERSGTATTTSNTTQLLPDEYEDTTTRPNDTMRAPLDIYSSDRSFESTNKPLLSAEEVLGRRFTVHQRLVGHNSPVFRVAFLSDGRLISGERIGKTSNIAIQANPQSTPVLSHILLWNKDGNSQNLPNEGTLEDFVAAPNGTCICHIGRVFGVDLTVQLYVDGRSVWQSNGNADGWGKSELPHLGFSMDADELMMVTRQGGFTRLNLKTGKKMTPVASLINIDKSSVECMSVSQKLEHALFGLRNGEFLAIRTKDGKQVSAEKVDSGDSPKALASPAIAIQFNQKEKRIAILHSNGTIGLFDFPSLERLADLPQTLNGSIRVLGRSTNGRFLAAIGDGMRVSVYDLETGEVFASWELPKPDMPTSISIDNFGKRIAIGFDSGSVLLFQSAKE